MFEQASLEQNWETAGPLVTADLGRQAFELRAAVLARFIECRCAPHLSSAPQQWLQERFKRVVLREFNLAYHAVQIGAPPTRCRTMKFVVDEIGSEATVFHVPPRLQHPRHRSLGWILGAFRRPSPATG